MFIFSFALAVTQKCGNQSSFGRQLRSGYGEGEARGRRCRGRGEQMLVLRLA